MRTSPPQVGVPEPAAASAPPRPRQVRKGQLGHNRQELSPEMQARIEAKWREIVLPATGHASYEGMRAAINRELGRPFKSAQQAAAGAAQQ